MKTDRENETKERTARILIVDDEEFIRNSFQLYFETLDYRALVADGGESALKLFRELLPDLDVVLLDLVMPGMHGIEILERMKEIDPDVEVIIATGCGNMHTAIQALRHGAFDYITKPIVNFEEDLLKVVLAALENRRSRTHRRTQPEAAPANRRQEGTPDPLSGLEGIVSMAATGASADEKFGALGAFLERHLEAEAAIAFMQDSSDKLRCLGFWGEFQHGGWAGGGDLPLLQAAAIVATLSEEPRWQAVHPEVSAFAGCRPPEDSPRMEALLLPIEALGAAGSDSIARLLVLRRMRRVPRKPFEALTLLALVASRLLTGEPRSQPCFSDTSHADGHGAKQMARM